MSTGHVCKSILDFSEEEKKGAFVSLEESRKRRNPEKHKDIVLNIDEELTYEQRT